MYCRIFLQQADKSLGAIIVRLKSLQVGLFHFFCSFSVMNREFVVRNLASLVSHTAFISQ